MLDEKEGELQPSRFPKKANSFVVAVLAMLMVVGGYELWEYPHPPYAFSQSQYDKGYLMAFRMNSTASGNLCFFKDKFWSLGKGFDDGKRDFDRIYQHPNVGPFSYDWTDRLREVTGHIEESTLLEPKRKKIILQTLKEDLAKPISKTIKPSRR